MWQQWVNTLLGIWIIVLAFLGLTGSTLMWTLIVTGVIVAVLGLWSAASSPAGRLTM